MSDASRNQSQGLDLAGLEIDDLEISDFFDDTLVQESEAVAKVMAASCTTCECCCSCCALVAKTEIAVTTAKIALVESHYTPELLKIIKARDPKNTDPQRYAEAAWPELIQQVTAEMAKGTDPTSGQVHALARRWVELVHMFSGGHPDIENTLHDMYRKVPHPAEGLGVIPDRRVFEFIGKALTRPGS